MSKARNDSAARQDRRTVFLGGVAVGGGAPISIQSMVRSPTGAPERVLEEIGALAHAGCDIVRVAVASAEDLAPLATICTKSPLPVVADVHFPIELAAQAVAAGAHGVRVNPLVSWPDDQVRNLAEVAEEGRAVIRVGANAGRWEGPRDQAAHGIVERVAELAERLEAAGATQIKVSAKSSDPEVSLTAYRLLAARCRWPIHLGLTEAGPGISGTAKSAAVMALLLSEGIGDTIRISLSGPATDEVVAARALLQALGLGQDHVTVVSCPGCGRAHRDVAPAAHFVERQLEGLAAPLTVAVMGCEVNGPGESKAADVGIAATPKGWVLFECGVRRGVLTDEEGPRALVALARRLATRPNRRGGPS